MFSSTLLSLDRLCVIVQVPYIIRSIYTPQLFLGNMMGHGRKGYYTTRNHHIAHAIFIFCPTAVVQNMKITWEMWYLFVLHSGYENMMPSLQPDDHLSPSYTCSTDARGCTFPCCIHILHCVSSIKYGIHTDMYSPTRSWLEAFLHEWYSHQHLCPATIYYKLNNNE